MTYNEIQKAIEYNDISYLPDYVHDEIWSAVEEASTHISISEPIKLDQVGLQLEYEGIYHDKDGNALFHFLLESGIHRGSLILDIAPPDIGVTATKPVTTIYRFWVKDETNLLSLKKLQASWDYFQEQARKMSYDKAFSPTIKTNEYYQNYADNIGGKIISFTGTSEDCHEWEALLKTKLETLLRI